MRFQAAILERTGGPLILDEIELEALAPGDVLIRLGASGLCHTDLEVIEGRAGLSVSHCART
jgi:Zn-dependent alcohol dehydrogenase